MKLEQLRAAEERLREELDSVRAKLAAAVGVIDAGDTASRELEAVQKPSDGVYRRAAGERSAELHVRVGMVSGARTQREHCRRDEAKLLSELERTRRRIEKQGVRRSVLPRLEDVPDASPCAVRWNDLEGDGDARACRHCKAAVLNVALLDGPQVEALIAAKASGQNLFRRADGTLIAGDCGDAPARHRFAKIGATAVGVMIGLAAAVGFILSHFEHPASKAAAPPPAVGFLTGSAGVVVVNNPPSPYAGWKLTVAYTRQGSSDTVDAALDHQQRDVLVTLRCSKNGTKSSTYQQLVDGEAVDDFLRTTFAHSKIGRPNADEQCSPDTLVKADEPDGTHHTIDQRSCTHRWFVDGAALSPSDAACRGHEHCDIARTFNEALASLPVAKCNEELLKRR